MLESTLKGFPVSWSMGTNLYSTGQWEERTTKKLLKEASERPDTEPEPLKNFSAVL